MFYGFVITEGGNRLLAQMVAGQTLRLTRTVMEKGTAENAEAARKLIAPLDPGPEGVGTVPVAEGNSVHWIVEYRSDLNGGLVEGFWIGGFAIYAEDPSTHTDVMIGYGSLGDARQYVSAYTRGAAPDVRRYPVSITVTEGVEVDTAYPAEAWMTAQDVADYVQRDLKPELLGEVRAKMDALIVIGETEPDAGPALWFDTRARASPEVEPVVLDLGALGDSGQVSLGLDGADYPIHNAVLNETPTEGSYSFDIL